MGLEVLVSGEAFPGIELKGEVVRASSEASHDSSSSPVPTFEITVQASALNEDEQQRIRVGMSAILEVTIYDNPEALMLPLEAVRNDSRGRYVLVRDEETGETGRVAVQTGFVSNHGPGF